MENYLGKILDASIVSSGRKVKNGTYITFETHVNITIGQYVDIVFDNKIHHFEVKDISIKGVKLSVDACEVGYYASRFDNNKDFDLRKLIDIDVVFVTDIDKIREIQQETCWC